MRKLIFILIILIPMLAMADAEMDNCKKLLNKCTNNYAKTEVIKDLLMEIKGDIDSCANGLGQTALILSVKADADKIVKFLLDEGADPDIQDIRYGNTALIYAVGKNNLKSARLLLDEGSNPNIENKRLKTALDYAKEYGFDDMVLLLEENGAW